MDQRAEKWADGLRGRSGVLPSQHLREAVELGVILADPPLAEGQIQPNSLDLRIGRKGHRVQCSFLAGQTGMTQRIQDLLWYSLDIDESGAVLEPNAIYLFELFESVNLPKGLAGRANPKSSTGRLDIFARVVTENGETYDEVPDGYAGPLYLEVVPRSFGVRIRPGDTLAQLRLFVGEPRMTDGEVEQMLADEVLVLSGKGRYPLGPKDVAVAGGISLSVRIHGETRDQTIGFRARRSTQPIDLAARGSVSIEQHWERIYSRKHLDLILEPDAFYIFASRELVRLPPTVCGEMVPFDPTRGEVRTHYAGFFDSGFGYAPNVLPAQSAGAIVLEVRNRDVPFLLEHGQPLFRVELFKNLEAPDMLYGQAGFKSNYQSQRLKLGKQFNTRGGSGRAPSSQFDLPLNRGS